MFKSASTLAVLAALSLPIAAKADDVVTLKLAFPAPPASLFNTEALDPWSKQLEKDTNGAVKVQIFGGPTLASFANVLDRVLNGVADIGFVNAGPYGSQFRQTSVTELPFLSDNAEDTAVAMWRLYTKGVIAGEYASFKPLVIGGFPSIQFRLTKPAHKIEDFKGLKLGAITRTAAQVASALGAAPVTMTPIDLYPSAQRGLVDGLVTGWAATSTFKLYEVTSFAFDIPLGQGSNFVAMNSESFAKLPEIARKSIDARSGEPLAHVWGRAGDHETVHGREAAAKQPGFTIAKPTPDEEKRFRVALAPITEEWVKSVPDGARVLEAFKSELDKVRAERK